MDEYKGIAYNDMVIIGLDDIEEMVLALCKEYNMQYDVTVIYAKMSNEKAFSSYNDYLNLDEQGQGKYVTDYGKPKPFVYEVLTVERQLANIEEKKDGLRSMYRQGRKLND